jgi:CDGSH-type Zn-finger protein
MLCSRCYGRRMVMENGQPLPCPECGGFGDVPCCDGLHEAAVDSASAEAELAVTESRSTASPGSPRTPRCR